MSNLYMKNNNLNKKVKQFKSKQDVVDERKQNITNIVIWLVIALCMIMFVFSVWFENRMHNKSKEFPQDNTYSLREKVWSDIFN